MFFALLTGVAAQISVPTPPYGIPVTLHTLLVLISAMCLGASWGTLAMSVYVLLGLAGMPVFSEMSSGPGVLFGVTGGYIVGFIACQPVVYWIVRRKDGTARGWGGLILASLAGHAVVFLIGVPWLMVALPNEPWRDVLWNGVVPFIPGTLIKTAAAVWIGRLILPWGMRNFW